ncbi:hypothetical protein MRU69_11295 [Kocuria flava]|uniref:hypothetical protein n=1 Tax=Kocuria flava TaxID=446860 RepID=UPI001FF618EB|nr:hypothetical protein [Kocuria flava]MCJ8505437.1 hypothetical protein [Kocuria flava]
MPKSKPRKKAAAKKKQERRRFHAGAAAPEPEITGAEQGTWDDDAHELLVARGWTAYRDLEMDQLGDGWEWLPSQLPLDAGVGGEPGPTSVFAAAEGGFDVELASASGSVAADRTAHYETLEELAGDLDAIEAWRVPDGEYVLPEVPSFSGDTPEEICRLWTGGMIDHWELVADLIHFPYDEVPGGFAAVERAHRLGQVPTNLYEAVLRGRAG